METANGRGTIEQALFGQTGANNEVVKSRVSKGDAPGWASNTSQYISKLNSTNKVGPNQLLKVMAGDQLSTTVQYYYQTTVSNSSGSTVFNDVLGMLASAITGSGATSAATKNAATTLTGNLNTGTPFSQVIASDITSPTGDKPKAYLNIVFFDERFNFVEEASTSQRVSQSGDAASALGLLNIKAPKNGYCFVYISNESSANVFFDNLQVRHDRGRIIEENHYYAHGLKIAAISSKAYGAPNSNYLYQGDFSEMDDDLGWNDFELRSYDQFASGYIGMGNDPVNNIDPSGGWAATGIFQGMSQAGIMATTTLGGAIIGGVVDYLTGGDGFTGAALGAGIGLGSNFASAFKWKGVVNVLGKVAPSIAVQGANLASGAFDNGTTNPYASFASVGGSDEWKPFYKSDLITYTQSKGISPTENNLGEQFENIFEETMTSNFPVQTKLMRFRRAGKVWTEGTGRNSKPDFVSDDFYDQNDDCWVCPAKMKWVIEGSGYEVKQNSGRGIYLSSNDAQIRGHIDNLAAKHAADIATGNFKPSLTLITTYDVSWSPSITRYAGFQKVQYTHRRAMYRIVNGKYQFKFVGFGLSSL